MTVYSVIRFWLGCVLIAEPIPRSFVQADQGAQLAVSGDLGAGCWRLGVYACQQAVLESCGKSVRGWPCKYAGDALDTASMEVLLLDISHP